MPGRASTSTRAQQACLASLTAAMLGGKTPVWYEDASGAGRAPYEGAGVARASPPTISLDRSTMQGQARQTVLVVNDDPVQLRLTTRLIERAGLDVIACESAEEALRILRGLGPVDAVVTDLHMPGIDGWHFCWLLRSPEYPDINDVPILAVSATYSEVDAAELTADLGANAFLRAPFVPADLIKCVRDLVVGKHDRSAAPVLIAEREEARADRLRLAFARHGYAPHVVREGEELIRLQSELHPTVIVIEDAFLAEMEQTWVDAAQHEAARPVLVVVSRRHDPSRAVALIRRGVEGYVCEPFDDRYLLDLCRRARRQRSLMRVEEALDLRTRQLRDSELRFRSLFEGIPEAVLVRDADGVLRHVNGVAARWLGMRAEQLIGRCLREFAQPVGNVPLANEDGAEARAPALYETTLTSPDGQCRTVEMSERRIRFEGQPAILAVARDVTAKKELERARAEVVAMIAHDIKNPLTVLAAAAAMVRDLGELNEEQSDMLGRLEANAQEVLSLLTNYLNLSRIEARGVAISPGPVDLQELLHGVVVRYQGEARRRGVELRLEREADLNSIDADEMALQRVLDNLVYNALKFTPRGQRVTLTGARHGPDEVELCVSDTGPGIAAEELPGIFESYGLTSQRRKGQGSGLGLAIVKALVEAHGGHVDVRTQPGEGTTFSIVLPACALRSQTAS